ncbi:MAG: hypothetical protein LQ340_000640 [Diploschistes diacapsis]|nr:MAG: hypothetical protein LQ340_000640 [Diploschistes diacapsis]
MLRSTNVLPRRLTQLFADNKKSYEALVQPRQSGPELSHLHLKLRIQKDRLIAWGIQWSDRSAQTGDIDQSLVKAGISDLVASIMCSIRELLDEAESLQPPGPTAHVSEDWTTANIRRLEEILKDLTTSIDTLCDLSRSKVEGPEVTAPSPKNFQAQSTQRNPPASSRQAQHVVPSEQIKSPALPSRRDGLTDLAYIHPTLIRQRSAHNRLSASPPSYESVATGTENRTVALFTPPSSHSDPFRTSARPKQTPVLLDYGQLPAGAAQGTAQPDRARFEELLLALLKFPGPRDSTYTGILKLTGWTSDPSRSRSAFIYEIPPSEGGADPAVENLQPRSLLSFLQHGGDADNNNIPSLENRFKLAHNVVLSILRLHETNVAHRNINSNNLLFFLHHQALATQPRIWKTSIIRKPYLTGFHQRASVGPGHSNDVPFTGLYHHPALGGEHAASHELAHDYYSLGLVLLEIGLWMPIGKFWKSRYTLWDLKTRLQDIYLRKLSPKCGEGYMNAVLACITAADVIRQYGEHNPTLDGQAQLARFRELVVGPLERICRMDRDSEPCMPSNTSEQPAGTEAADRGAAGPGVVSPEEASADVKVNRSSTATVAPQLASTEIVRKAPKEQPKIRVWSHEIPTLYLTYWTTTMFPKLERMLRKALSRMESYTIDLFMAGKDPDTARPTVYMECTSTSKCQRILRHLNKELRLFEIKVVSGKIVRSKAGKKKRKGGKKVKATADGMYELDPSVEDLNPSYQEQPICGASIGAYLNGSHLPPVTFGGAVLVDGEPFGMSVHHMLEDGEGIEAGLEDRIDLQRSMASRDSTKVSSDMMTDLDDRFGGLHPFEVSEPPETEDTSSIGYPCSTISSEDVATGSPPTRALYPFDIPDDDFELDSATNEDDPENDFWLSPDFDATALDSDDDDEIEMGDTDGILPGRGSSLQVTQPALDDVHDGFFPSPEDVDSEHLSSHSLGYVHASSGLRRTRGEDSLIHEIDWALIKIHPERLPPCLQEPSSSSIKGSWPANSTLGPVSILPSANLPSRSVHSHTRSSGLFARGTILPTMRLVKMPGRISPSHSWQVRGSFGGGGDSGAWVFDDATGAVCGHVLAYSDRSGVAYIAPMEVLVSDMERVLGKGVGMPGRLPLPTVGGEAAVGGSVLREGAEDVGLADVIDAQAKATSTGENGKTKAAPPAPAATPDRSSKQDGRRSTPSPALPTSPPIISEKEPRLREKRKSRDVVVGGVAKGRNELKVAGIAARV